MNDFDTSERRSYFDGFGQQLTPVIIALLLCNVGVYFLQLLLPGNGFVALFGLIPAGVTQVGMFWQPLTGLFLHNGLWSLLMDLLVLWFFAPDVQLALGRGAKFILFYLVCGVSSNIVAVILAPSSGIPILGPGGAIFAILTAYGLLFPQRIVTLLLFFVLPLQIKAKFLVMIFGGIAWFGLMEGRYADIARYASLAGIPIGFVLVRSRYRWGALFRDGQRTSRKVETREEYIRRRIDPILEKIAREGIHSLTWWEKRVLRKMKK